jgi:hypothetical protein
LFLLVLDWLLFQNVHHEPVLASATSPGCLLAGGWPVF